MVVLIGGMFQRINGFGLNSNQSPKLAFDLGAY